MSDDSEEEFTFEGEKTPKPMNVESNNDTKPKPRKVKREEDDDDDDDFIVNDEETPVKKKKKKKKKIKEEVSKKKRPRDDDVIKKKKKKIKSEPQPSKVSSSSSSPTKKQKQKQLKKLDKTERLQYAMQSFLWWDAKEPPEGCQWETMEHAGVSFPEAYVPHNIKLLYEGKPVDLTPSQEEAATFFAAMDPEGMHLGNPKTAKIFIKNFFTDFKAILGKKHFIKDFTKCDFEPIRKYLNEQKIIRKAITDQERKANKEDRNQALYKFGFAIVDGHLERVGNYNMEPPGYVSVFSTYFCRRMWQSLMDSRTFYSYYSWTLQCLSWTRRTSKDGKVKTTRLAGTSITQCLGMRTNPTMQCPRSCLE